MKREMFIGLNTQYLGHKSTPPQKKDLWSQCKSSQNPKENSLWYSTR